MEEVSIKGRVNGHLLSKQTQEDQVSPGVPLSTSPGILGFPIPTEVFGKLPVSFDDLQYYPASDTVDGEWSGDLLKFMFLFQLMFVRD
ncbi:hypothetical protein CK203_053271 [Vitis vinifera]|uniref:Uncharacterized protein n=1 Tax=Vitis vinifera TaxID=29760 RepID=A0A438CWM6_VITVI|nr:hypothetical protein CK203_103598 [Vitis vinifera]RVW74295.1 hypothetical protein CK203_053271 [Vitis vinifera]